MYKIFPFRNPNGGNGILNEIDEVSVHKVRSNPMCGIRKTTMSTIHVHILMYAIC